MSRWFGLAALGAAASLAVSAGAAAETGLEGFAGFDVGYVDLDLGGRGGDAAAYGASGSWSVPLGERFGLQVDAGYQKFDGGVTDDDVVTGAAHIFVRDSESHAVGAFVADEETDGQAAWGGGVEVALYRGGLTYDAEFAVLKDEETDVEAAGGATGVTYFPRENLSVEAGVSVVELDTGAADVTAFGVSFGAEWQARHTPVSVYLEAGYERADDLDREAATVTVGVQLHSGGSQVYGRDRRGPSMNGARRLLRFLRL